jgi:hypothetical protein
MNRLFTTTVILLLLLFNLKAQKFEIVSGNPKPFSTVRLYYLTFDYSGLQVGKYGDEQNYIDYKMDDAEKRKKGSSGDWLKNWQADRRNFYQPKFIELFNTNFISPAVKCDTSFQGQKVELNLHTKFIEPGFNINAKRSPALINVIVTITEINNPENAFVVSITDVPGHEVMGSYYPDNRRIAEAYAKCGKELAKYMLKVIY